jgi:hypothetical protein
MSSELLVNLPRLGTVSDPTVPASGACAASYPGRSSLGSEKVGWRTINDRIARQEYDALSPRRKLRIGLAHLITRKKGTGFAQLDLFQQPASALTARDGVITEFFSGLDAVKVPLNLEVLVIGLLTPGQNFITQAWKILKSGPVIAQHQIALPWQLLR